MSKLIWLAIAGGLAYAWTRRPRRLAVPADAGDPAAQAGSSPNAAERLQQSHAGGAYAGIGALLPDGGQNTALMPATGGTGVDGAPGGQAGQADDDIRPPGLDQMYRGA